VERGKSDRLDAISVARAALQHGLDGFPAAQLDGPELDLRLLVDHRERLSAIASNSTARCCAPARLVARAQAARRRPVFKEVVDAH